jgi:cyanophycinase
MTGEAVMERNWRKESRLLAVLRALAPIVLLMAVRGTSLAQGTAAKPAYLYYRIGSPDDLKTQPQQGAALMGGGKDLDSAFRWLCERVHGGDFLVLGASAGDEYNSYVNQLCHLNSVATLVLPNREAAEDPFSAETIRHAEAIFITGGDQSNYIKFWQGTPVQTAINERMRDGVPLGGTSAGLAVLGEFVFTAMNDTAYSKPTLADPYNKEVTLGKDFLRVPYMAGILTDQHFVKRDRLGRSLGFMARILEDGMATSVREIAVDERNAVLVDENGAATLVGKGAAYFLHPTRKPDVCQAGKPLTFRGIEVYRISRAGKFNLKTWTGEGGTSYRLSAVDGKLESSNASIY